MLRTKSKPRTGGDRSGPRDFDQSKRLIDSEHTLADPRLQDRHLVAPIRVIAIPMGVAKWRATVDGETICVASSPLIAAARLLIAQGVDSSSIIELWHQHAAAWSLRGKLGPVASVVLDGEQKGTQPAKNRAPVRFPGTDAVQQGSR
jgi:hypothetical protein